MTDHLHLPTHDLGTPDFTATRKPQPSVGPLDSIVNEMSQCSYTPSYANGSPSNDHSVWPISSWELASLIDLGLSDDQIAKYFGVEQVNVSAIRAYYGLA